MWGAFLISLVVLSVNTIFTLNYKEEQANDHLVRARCAARAITTFMKFLLARKRYNIIKRHREENMHLGAEDLEIDLSEVMNCERDMLLALQEFKTMNKDLFAKNVNEKQRTIHINFIKDQILELGDRFDRMSTIQEK